MYDYVDGKVDWMAYGLPVEGDEGPFVGQEVSDPATCHVNATVGEARRCLQETGAESALVIHGPGLVVGEVDGEALAGTDDDRSLLDVMRPVPSTVRPSATVPSLAGSTRVVVTTSDGRLLGEAVVPSDEDHGHEDHEGHEHEASPELRRMERELTQTMEAVASHFGDREPSDEELRSFLRELLVSEGRSPEEADRFMADLDDQNRD